MRMHLWLACWAAAACGGPSAAPVEPATVQVAPPAPGPFLDDDEPERPAAPSLSGKVRLLGDPPKMVVPPRRLESEYCKEHPLVDDAVRVNKGGLADTMIILRGKLPEAQADEEVVIASRQCQFRPHVLGVFPSQLIRIANEDDTLINVNAKRDGLMIFNTAMPKGAPPLKKSFEELGIYILQNDVHSWMQAFVFVVPHRFFAVSDEHGAFSIDDVPPGEHAVEAIHPRYGKKEMRVEVKADASTRVEISYQGDEPQPDWSRERLSVGF